ELHALRGRIAALPREERWEALARRALWEDLQSEHRALTADVLRESGNGRIADRLGTWVTHNGPAVERCMQVLADVKAGDASDLAATPSTRSRQPAIEPRQRRASSSSASPAAHSSQRMRA